MTRIARITIPEYPHHITQRGNRRQKTFFEDADYLLYLKYLEIAAKAFQFDIWSYCLMPNHVHLLVVPKTEESLRDGIGQVHHSYTKAFNKKHNWTGHLWQGRFYSCPTAPDAAAIVARYIELNPVRAGLCAHPCDYRWSSAGIACSTDRLGQNGFSPLQSPFGTWQNFLCQDLRISDEEIKLIRERVHSGRPFGGDDFVSELETMTGRILLPKKRGPKKIGKPSALSSNDESFQ